MKHLDLTTLPTSGFHLIEASAGTGKTWTISALYILLLLENRMKPEEILVVTYTKSATAELRDRIRTRINDTLNLFSSGRAPRDGLEEILLSQRPVDADSAIKLLTRALYSFDNAAIFTIHGFCQRALLEHAFESGSLFDTDMVNDQSAILHDVCDDFWRTRIISESDCFLKFLDREGFTPTKLAEPFKGHYQNPELGIIPATADPDLEREIALCTALAPQIAVIWNSDRSTIIQKIIQANLSQTSYKESRIESASHELDNWLAAGNFTEPCPKLKLFSTAALLAGQKKGSSLPVHPFFQLCQELSDALQAIEQACRHKLIYYQTALHDWIRKELTSRKRSLNLRCYDDLLLDLQRALTGPEGKLLAHNLRDRYHAALIDEFQDTDPLQWKIFQCIGNQEGYPLYLIGDPKQAIYSFRGADIYAYAAASEAVSPDNKATLQTNRRSTKTLIGAVNALFSASPDPFLSSTIRFSPVDSGRDVDHHMLQNGCVTADSLRFWVYEREDQAQTAKKPDASAAIVRAMAAEISRLLDSSCEINDRHGRRPLKPGDIAVLVKAHYQSDLVQTALNALSIPSVQRGSATIFESSEALDLLRILRAVHEPSRESLIREALLTGTMGIPADQIACCLASGESTEWDSWMVRFRTLHETARSGGVMAVLELLLDECGVRNTSLSRTGGERSLTNILQCVELLHSAELEHAGGMESLIIWLEQQITSGCDDENALLRLETDDNAVQISTIHASKGLEYPVVFLPFAWDAPAHKGSQILFHDEEGHLFLDLGSEQLELNKELARREREAEAARLLYVALTRAEFLCYVVWGCIADAHTSPLFRLLHSSTVSDAKKFKARPDPDILQDIITCGTQATGLRAEFMPINQAAVSYIPSESPQHEFTYRSLKDNISQDWRVSSFSSMIAGSERGAQPHDYDAFIGPRIEMPAVETAAPDDGWTIFDFPRGAAAGTCLHKIFELLDFSDCEYSQISRISRTCLQESGYHEQWLPCITAMVAQVTAARIIPDTTFTLSLLKNGTWNSETEFYLPLNLLSPLSLRDLFQGVLDPSRHGSFDEILHSLNFHQSRGMLHGFMDMIFEHDGRYYIVDWKSNHLGSDIRNYSQPDLIHSMAEHAYILQYHLYTLALDRYLRQRLPDYSYETHFGGAIYLYLRGLSNQSPQNGVFFDRPSSDFIQKAQRSVLS